MGRTILPPLLVRYAAVGYASLALLVPCALAAAIEDAAVSDVGSSVKDTGASQVATALEQERAAYMNEDGFNLFQQTLPRTPRDLADYVVEKTRRQTSSASLAELSQGARESTSEVNAASLAVLRQEKSAYRPGARAPPIAGGLASILGPTDTCLQLMWYGYGSTDECRDSWSPELGSNCRCERQGTAWPVKYCTTSDEGESQLSVLGLAPAPPDKAAGDEDSEENIAMEDVWGRCERCCSRDHIIGWPTILTFLLVVFFCLNTCILPIVAPDWLAKKRAAGEEGTDAQPEAGAVGGRT